MKDEIKKQLDAMFAEASAEKKQVEVKRDMEAEARAEFLQQFQNIRDVDLAQALNEFAAYVRPHGWEAAVRVMEEQAGQLDRRGDTFRIGQPASIALEFSREGAPVGRGDHPPRFAIICETAAREVRFHESTMGPGHGGSSGSAGTAKLDQLTPDFIHEKLVAYFTKLMKDSGAIKGR